MLELTNHIKSINEKSKKDMDSNPNLWIGTIVEDLEHWAEYGITTPAQFDRYQDECCLYEVVSSEYSKSYARSLRIGDMTDKELADAFDSYSKTSL